MPRPDKNYRIFKWSALTITGLCLALLIALVSHSHFGPSTGVHITQHHADKSVHGARFGGRIATVLKKPVPVQYVTPPLNLQPLFDRLGYNLEFVRRYGVVPRIFLARLPRNLKKIRRPNLRKGLFIKMALPLILHANELILWDRNRILNLIEKSRAGKTISATDQTWLGRKALEYGLAEPDLTELVRRVDVIPPSLALAQAAEESGWGTSRFAREGNAIFGQRTWGSHVGMKPTRREPGQTFKVRTFDLLIDGIMSYTRNLNGHHAYEDFRRMREAQRRNGGTLDGYALATALKRYSERGKAYIETIRMLMRINELQAFDKARLGDQRVAELGRPDA